MNKKKKKNTDKIVKPNSENYTFLNQNHITSNSLREYAQESKTTKEIEKIRRNSRNIKFHYTSKNIRTKQGHSPVYE
jgi:hypothetical protein